MATVFTANSSGVLINNTQVEGLRTIEYQVVREQSDVHAVGSPERVAVYYGATRVKGRLHVASTNADLDALTQSGEAFQVVANLRHGDAGRSVAFDDCYMERKEFALNSGSHGETVYLFTATRVREEDSAG